jgi:hypothetical protein
MPVAEENGPGLAYLFAAEGCARISPADGDFAPIELPTRAIVAVPASAPAWKVEDLGGLKLIRITPRWPAAEPWEKAS